MLRDPSAARLRRAAAGTCVQPPLLFGRFPKVHFRKVHFPSGADKMTGIVIITIMMIMIMIMIMIIMIITIMNR